MEEGKVRVGVMTRPCYRRKVIGVTVKKGWAVLNDIRIQFSCAGDIKQGQQHAVLMRRIRRCAQKRELLLIKRKAGV